MLTLGIILLIAGYLIPIPILYTLGWILTIIGVILLVLDYTGRPIGGRRWY
jgi:hypothetical protein